MNILDIKKENFPPWFFEKVYCPEDLDNFQFYYYDNCTYEEISVDKIVGTTHCDYYHKAWLEMLSNLKHYKTDNDINFVKAIILRKDDDKSVHEYNGKYYIVAGNHRFCQAKFLGISKVYCSVSKYKFNHQDFSLYKELINNNFTCTYSGGIFRDIKLGNICIYVNSKEDIYRLISAYQKMRISFFDKIAFSRKAPVSFFRFNDDKDSYNALKHSIFLQKNNMIIDSLQNKNRAY